MTIETIKSIAKEQLLSVNVVDRGGEKRVIFIFKGLPMDLLNKVKKHMKPNYLLLTQSELEDGTDVFPLEFLHMQNHYTLTHGMDILKTLKFDKRHVRRQLEFEFRSKLIHLREQYLLSTSKSDQRKLLLSALPTLSPMLDGLLYLQGKQSTTLEQDLQELHHDYQLNLSLFATLFEAGKSSGWFKGKSLKGQEEDFIAQLASLLEQLSHTLDKWRV